jgi:hypothetical protein
LLILFRQYKIQLRLLCRPFSRVHSVGEAVFYIDGKELTRRNVVAKKDVDEINCIQMFGKCLKKWATLY